jgi:hypothetical protein
MILLDMGSSNIYDGQLAAGSFVGVRSGFPSHGTFNMANPNYTWTIPTLPAGETAVVAFDFTVADPNTVSTVTGPVGSGNGTRASWEEYVAGNTYQTGEICELRIGPGLTEAVVSRFEVKSGAGGSAMVEWETASEVGTLGFYVERRDSARGKFVRLNDEMIPGLGLSAPQGGRYRFEDSGVAAGESASAQTRAVAFPGRRQGFGWRCGIEGRRGQIQCGCSPKRRQLDSGQDRHSRGWALLSALPVSYSWFGSAPW